MQILIPFPREAVPCTAEFFLRPPQPRCLLTHGFFSCVFRSQQDHYFHTQPLIQALPCTSQRPPSSDPSIQPASCWCLRSRLPERSPPAAGFYQCTTSWRLPATQRYCSPHLFKTSSSLSCLERTPGWEHRPGGRGQQGSREVWSWDSPYLPVQGPS